MTDAPYIQGWFDFSNLYDRMAAEVPDDGLIVECGVWKGASLCYMALKLAELKRDAVGLVGIDLWIHREWDGYQAIINCDKARGEHRTPLEQCEANLRSLGLLDRVDIIHADSICAAQLFDENSVDFLFLDDTHNSDHVKREIAAWLPKMKHPSVIAGHDYPGNIKEGVLHHFPDVKADRSSWIQEIP